jgi:hypothetical protein
VAGAQGGTGAQGATGTLVGLQTITGSGAITPDAGYNLIEVIATGTISLSAPSGTPTNGQVMTIKIYASGATQTISSWASTYLGGSDILSPGTVFVNVSSGKWNYYGFRYQGGAGAQGNQGWACIAYARGY